MRILILPLLVLFAGVSSGRQCTKPPPGAIVVKLNNTAPGEFSDLGEAVNSLPADSSPQVVFVYPGVYHGQVNISRAGPVKIMGYTKNSFDFDQNTVTLTHSAAKATAGNDDLSGTLRVITNSSNVSLYNLDIRNTYGVSEVNGQAIALSNFGNQVGVYACRMYSYQDTLYTNLGNHVYLRSYIEGAVDFIFGRQSQAYFEGNTIASTGAGCITASGRQLNDSGIYVFNQNKVIAARDAFVNVTGNVFLGRPWGAYARVVFKNTYVTAPMDPTIWSIWSPGDERVNFTLFAEYNSFGPGVAHAHRANFSTALTRSQASQYNISSTVGANYRDWVDLDYLL
ncbi:pectin lyase fold/virulence factor [Mycena sp. CBHHK59/15]|nr:pectin lyase fold/virulence factor [Mycena sp. CBHHK59/15]